MFRTLHKKRNSLISTTSDMLLERVIPSPALNDFVRYFGIVHFTFSKGDLIPPKTYSPRPGEALYFLPKDTEYMTYVKDGEKTKNPPAFIMGQHTLSTHRFVGRDFLTVIVHFQPGALYRLTGIPSYEFTNTCIDAEALFQTEIRTVNEQLNSTASYQQMIGVVESYLLKLVSRSRKSTHSIEASAKILLQNTEHISMDWLANETCLCQKQFERKFQERMGINPSLFARLARFDKTYRIKNAHPEKDWLSIAVSGGYYDYQHLVRDYKIFTGFTPVSFFHLDQQAPERLFNLHE